MEDPATWRRAENVILKAYNDWHKMNEAGAAGPSIAKHIADALREAGVLRDENESPEGASFVKW